MMKQTKQVIRIFIFLVLAITGISSVSADQPDGRTILRKMLDAEGSVAFIAHQVTTIARGPAVTSEQIIYRAGFRGMRTEYIEPPALKGEVMADDGRVLAHFIPKEKVVKMRPSRLANVRMRTEQAAQAFRHGGLAIELVGKDRIADRSAYMIVVKPKFHRHHGPIRKFWVDDDKWVKLKTEDIAPDGTVASMSYYTKIDFADTIPDEKFRFDPPDGVRVEREPMPPPRLSVADAEKQVGFKILEPSYLPRGFKPVGAMVVPFRQGKLVALRYTDGVTSFSLFQSPGRVLDPKFLKRLHEGPSRPRGDVYSWRRGSMSLTLVGRIPVDELRRIAGSVK